MTDIPESSHGSAIGSSMVRLDREFRRKPCGILDLSPWFSPQTEKTCEVWFTSPGTTLPLLIKLLFAGETLSVQGHPDDEYAQKWVAHPEGRRRCPYRFGFPRACF
jgi:hypothetical protein